MRNGKTYGVTISKGSLNRFIKMANDTLIPMKACGLLVIEHLSSPAFVPGEETGGDVPHGEENNCF